MAVETLTSLPATIQAGDTVRLEIGNASYPATAWTLSYTVKGVDNRLAVAGVAAGASFTVLLTSANTALLAPGQYDIIEIYTETASSERVSVSSGQVTVLPNPASNTVKTWAQETLELAEAAITAIAANPRQTVSIAGSSFGYRNLEELQKFRDTLKDEVAREKKAQDAAAGNFKSTAIRTRFV